MSKTFTRNQDGTVTAERTIREEDFMTELRDTKDAIKAKIDENNSVCSSGIAEIDQTIASLQEKKDSLKAVRDEANAPLKVELDEVNEAIDELVRQGATPVEVVAEP